MVELVIPKCPRCGAELQIKPGTTEAFCKYCEAQVLVVGTQPSAAAGDAARLEIEKKQMALGILAQELAEIEGAANRLLSEIKMMENPVDQASTKGSMTMIVLFAVFGMIGGFTGMLFYILDLYFVYGVTKMMCLIYSLLAIGIGVGGAAAMFFWTSMSQARRRNQNMQSPEYMMRVQQHQQMQAQAQAKRGELEATEQQLKMLLLGNPR